MNPHYAELSTINAAIERTIAHAQHLQRVGQYVDARHEDELSQLLLCIRRRVIANGTAFSVVAAA